MSATDRKIVRNGFSIVLLTSAFAEFGAQSYRFAIPLIVLDLTSNDSFAAGMRATMVLPSVLLGLLIGAVIDSVNKRVAAIWLLCAQTSLLAGIAFLFSLKLTQQFALYAITFFLALCSYAYSNLQTVLTRRLNTKPQLPSAIGKLTSVARCVTVVAPLGAGFALASPHHGYFLVVCCLAFAVPIFAMSSIPETDDETAPISFATLAQKIKMGLTFVRKSSGLVKICVVVALSNMAVSLFEISLLLLLRERLQLSTSTIGTIISCATTGGIVGSLILAQKSYDSHLRRTALIAAILVTMGLGAVGITRNVYIITILGFMINYAFASLTVCVYTIRQFNTPPELTGVVSGVTGNLFKIGIPLSIWLGGVLSNGFPSFVSMGCAAALMTASFIALFTLTEEEMVGT